MIRAMRTACLCLSVICAFVAAVSVASASDPRDAAGAAAPGSAHLPFALPLRPDETRIASPRHPHSSLMRWHPLPHHDSPAMDTSDALRGVFGSLIKRGEDTASFARWIEREMEADRAWAEQVQSTRMWTVFAPSNAAVDAYLADFADGSLPPRNALRSHMIPDQSIFLMPREWMPALMPLLTAASHPQVTLYLCDHSSEVRCDEAITAQARGEPDESQQGSPNAPWNADRIQLLRTDLTQENRVAGNGVIHLISHVLAGPAERPHEGTAAAHDQRSSRRAVQQEEAARETPLPPPEVSKSAKSGLGHSLRSGSAAPSNATSVDAAEADADSVDSAAPPPVASTLLDPLQAELGAPLQVAPPGAPHPAAKEVGGGGGGIGPVPPQVSPFEPPSPHAIEQAAQQSSDRQRQRRRKHGAGGGALTWRGLLFLAGVAVLVVLLSVGLVGMLVRHSPRVDACWNAVFGCCCPRRSAQHTYDEIDGGAHVQQAMRDERPLLSERGEAYQASAAGRKPPDM